MRRTYQLVIMATTTINLDLQRTIRLLPGYDPFAQAGDCTFDEEAASLVIEFVQECCTHVKGALAGKPLLLEDWQKAIFANLYGWKRPDGTRRYRECLIFVARGNGKTILAAAMVCVGLFLDDEPGAELYCLDETTRVFTSDFQWVPLSAVKVGDHLVAFDEHIPKPRHFRKLHTAIVTDLDRRILPSWRITFEDGRQVIASSQHKWLGRRSGDGGNKQWISTKELIPARSYVYDFGPPWKVDRSNEAGYLAGVFDGEGCFCKKKGKQGKSGRSGFRLTFAQKPGIVLDQTRRLCRLLGYNISPNTGHKSGVEAFSLQGAYNTMRFLGQVRPLRLLENAEFWYEGAAPNRVGGHLRVTGMDYLGDREVIAIGTSTNTLFAEGLFSHNSSAAERDQARLCFEVVTGMIRNEPEMSGRAELYKYSIVVDGKSYKALSSQAGSKHGFSPQLIVNDELHAHRTPELTEVLMTGTLKRRQPLTVHLTTSDYEREGSICNEKHDYASKVRDGLLEDPAFLPVIYEAGKEDALDDPKTWARANPNLHVSVPLEYLERECQRAKNDPAFENTFRRLHLNQRTEQSERLLPIERWDACKGELPELRHRKCWAGLDLGATRDFTAFVPVWPLDDGRYAIQPIFWIPEASAKRRQEKLGAVYRTWERAGALRITEGNEIDYAKVEADIAAFCAEHDVQEIAADRLFQGAQIVQNLNEKHGVATFEHGQGFISMAVPTRTFLEYVGNGKIVHDGNPVLRWMISNLTGKQDEAGNWKPDKKKSAEKIDGAVAAIMGLGRATVEGGIGKSVYEERGVLWV